MGFSTDAQDMDDTVDGELGDEILYKQAGTSTYVTILGFAGTVVRPLGFAEMDVAGGATRVKVQKRLVPTPTSGDRWKCDLLGPGAYQKTNKEPGTDGRYWVIELQKASKE